MLERLAQQADQRGGPALARQRDAHAAVTHKLDVVSGLSEPADTLRQNDLGTLELVLGDAILATTYLTDRALGSVLLIDPVEGDTVGAAMIIEL